jgi:hypothetical protein
VRHGPDARPAARFDRRRPAGAAASCARANSTGASDGCGSHRQASPSRRAPVGLMSARLPARKTAPVICDPPRKSGLSSAYAANPLTGR